MGLVWCIVGGVTNFGAHFKCTRRALCDEVSRHVLQVQWLPSDWLDCVAFWRRRENYPKNSHCLRVIFEKERSQSTLLSVALPN